MSDVRKLRRPPHRAELYARALTATVLPSALRGGDGSLPDQALEVTAEPDPDHVARFAEVCGFTAADPLPPTYPHILGFPLAMRLMTDLGFPMRFLGMVHVTNTITQRRPIGAGETLTVRVRAANLRPHHLGAEVDLLTEAHAGGEQVWAETSTYLTRGSSAGGDADPSPPREWPVPPQSAAATELRIPGDIGRRYAEVSGDVNPIHLSSVSAKAFGFPRAIAHGMWMVGRSLAEVSDDLPDAFTAAAGFRKPVLLPSDARLLVDRSASATNVWLTGATSQKTHVVMVVAPA